MKAEQLVRSIYKTLRIGSTGPIDNAGEIALLFVWKIISDSEQLSQGKIPTINQVVSGEISINDAHKRLQREFEIFKLSKFFPVWGILGDTTRQILQDLIDTEETTPEELTSLLCDLISQEGLKNEEIVIPESVTDLMISLANLNGDSSCYFPFARSFRLAVKASQERREVVFQAETDSLFFEAIAQIAKFSFINSDPLIEPITVDSVELRKFPSVIMAPPFGRKIKQKIFDRYKRFSRDNVNGDVLALEHGISQCSGRMVALVPQGFLFRSAHDYDLRAKIINKGIVDAVIQLPPSLLKFTPLAMAIIVIDKQRDAGQPVVFYDADQSELVKSAERGKPSELIDTKRISDEILGQKNSKYFQAASNEEITQNSFDLSVRKYVLGRASAGIKRLKDTVPLSSIAELIRGQLLKEESGAEGDYFYEVGAKNVQKNGTVVKPEKKLCLSGRMKDRAMLQRLMPGDILLATKGSVGKVGIVGKDCEDNWVANQSFQVVRLTHDNIKITPEVLFMYLSSPLVYEYLLEQVTGTTIPVIKTGDVKELPVPVPSREEQIKISETREAILSAHDEIFLLQKEIEKLAQVHWPVSKDLSN